MSFTKHFEMEKQVLAEELKSRKSAEFKHSGYNLFVVFF